MGLRPFKLPDDTQTLITLLPPAFQYPENPEWSIRNDDVEGMIDTMKTIRQLWPLLVVVAFLVPKLRDIIQGFIWEEDGQAVGLSNAGRQGMTDIWTIGNVGVLPSYRRKGIARSLVAACVTLAREHGASAVILDVIADNLPAYSLYERLGFETYGGQAEMDYDKEVIPPECPIPPGYTVSRLDPLAWRPRYELASRITPAVVQKFNPVTMARYKQPGILRPVAWLVERGSGIKQEAFVIRNAAEQTVVGIMRYSARKKAGGVNSIGVSLDEAHGHLAAYMVAQMLRTTMRESPGRRIEASVPAWQPDVLQAALAAGFRTNFNFKKMGLALK